MPWPAIVGNRTPLNLASRFAGTTNRVPLNLGVDSDTPVPPDPPDPTVIGLLTAGIRLPWGVGLSTRRATRPRWGGQNMALRRIGLEWGGAQSAVASRDAPWGVPAQVAAGVELAWGGPQAWLALQLQATWRVPAMAASGASLRWSRGWAGAAISVVAPWLAPPTQSRGGSIPWHGQLPAHSQLLDGRWSAPPRVQQHWRMPWGRGAGVDWLVRPPLPPPPEPPPAPLRDGRYVGLNLPCPVFASDTRRVPLNLGITACWNARLQRKAYVVLNEIEVVRLPDRLPIHVDAVSLDTSREDWAWNGRLALADPSQLPDLQPTVDGPRSVEIAVNGYKWVIAVERYDKGQVFGATDVTVAGRSVSAQLHEPYAAPRTAEVALQRTMAQLVDAEVADSAVTAEYGTVDWLVPAGAWYYQGLTPMAAMLRLAEASGAVVQSDPVDPVVRIRPRYPVSPWLWTTTTPDVVIQDDIVTGTRLQLQSKPLFDAVIVAGERVGVSARVRRDGEAGQTYAPQQVDQLITHADGARERGRNVLGDRGGQASIEHDLPLFGGVLQPGQPGLVLPLMLAQRVAMDGTWHGLVTGVRIEARRQGQAVDVNQTVTIERHYTDAD